MRFIFLSLCDSLLRSADDFSMVLNLLFFYGEGLSSFSLLLMVDSLMDEILSMGRSLPLDYVYVLLFLLTLVCYDFDFLCDDSFILKPSWVLLTVYHFDLFYL